MSSYKFSVLLSLIFFTAIEISCNHSEKKSDKIEIRVEQLLAKMTIDDKIG